MLSIFNFNKISKQSHDVSNKCYIQQQNEDDLRVIIKGSFKGRNMLLVSRFIRIIYNYNDWKYNMIPNDIHRIIFLFCNKVDRFLYGIGKNGYGCFGIAGNCSTINQWTFLAQFSSLCYGSYYGIYCGYQRYLIETQSNNVYVAGYNNYGASLISHNNTFATTAITHFQHVNKTNDIKVISNGVYAQHSIFVDANDEIYAFGSNLKGQYGNNTFDSNKINNYTINLNKINNYIPIRIDNAFCGNVAINKIECGNDYTLFLLKNGKIFSCGSNEFGQCGIDMSHNQNIADQPLILKPTEIECDSFIVDVECGASHNLILTLKKEIYAFGKNTSHQLGVPDKASITNPTLIARFEKKEIKVMICGENHSCVIDVDGKCYLFGSNAYGQIGNGTGGKSWDSVETPHVFKHKVIGGSAANHTVLISNTLQILYAFGHNNYNQCGIGGRLECHKPRSLSLSHFEENQNIVKVVAGHQTTLVVVE